MSNIRKIIIVILVITMFVFLGLGLNYMVKHYKKDEMNVKAQFDVVTPSTAYIDKLEQPSPNEEITLDTLPDVSATLNDIDFKTMKKLFQTTKKSILIIKKDNCSYCEEFLPEASKALEEMDVVAYTLNLTNLTLNESKSLLKYIYFEGTPTTFIIDQGKVSHVFNGVTSIEALQAFIDLYYVR